MEHNGIKVEFIGSIGRFGFAWKGRATKFTKLCFLELFYDKGKSHEFLTLSQELAAPGELRQNAAFEFEFKNVEKQYECYNGINVKLR